RPGPRLDAGDVLGGLALGDAKVEDLGPLPADRLGIRNDHDVVWLEVPPRNTTAKTSTRAARGSRGKRVRNRAWPRARNRVPESQAPPPRCRCLHGCCGAADDCAKRANSSQNRAGKRPASE